MSSAYPMILKFILQLNMDSIFQFNILPTEITVLLSKHVNCVEEKIILMLFSIGKEDLFRSIMIGVKNITLHEKEQAQ